MNSVHTITRQKARAYEGDQNTTSQSTTCWNDLSCDAVRITVPSPSWSPIKIKSTKLGGHIQIHSHCWSTMLLSKYVLPASPDKTSPIGARKDLRRNAKAPTFTPSARVGKPVLHHLLGQKERGLCVCSSGRNTRIVSSMDVKYLQRQSIWQHFVLPY